MKNYSVYKHILPKEISKKKNDMFYIGITSQKPKDRWQNGYGYRNNIYFWRAIKKYGWDNFRHEVFFEGLTKEEAEQKEIELIDLHKSNIREYGYIINHGGNCVGALSEETKNKISEKAKERYKKNGSPRLGKYHSEKTKLAISKITKERLSVPENNPFYGKHHSEETKDKLSKKAKERYKDPTKNPNYGNTKKVICLDDGIVYPSVKSVSEKFGLSTDALYRTCSGVNNKCGGYRFRYVDLIEREVG